jgi:hypothetical protein
MKIPALTPEEQELIDNAAWIYLKNSALQKVMDLFGVLQGELEAHPLTGDFPFPEGCLAKRGKISRGERYKELPYAILDYPRHFSRDDIFAFRTMFWWGHYFSATLHLAGVAKDRYSGVLAKAWSLLATHQFQIYVREDPWEHDFGKGNYKLISAMQAQEFEHLIYQLPFIKLAKPYKLALWEKIIPEVVMDYALLLQILVNK